MTERSMGKTGAVAEPEETMARVLVLDDDVGVCETLAAVLRLDGYAVRTAERLVEAESLLREEPFDVVLTDLHLDDDGQDPLDVVRALAPDAVVVVLTGYATLESALRALRTGAYAYLVKPTDVEELRLTVARGMEGRRLRRELARRVAELEAANAAVQDFNAQLRTQVAAATEELRDKVAELNATNRQLRQAQEQHERFVAMVAHELKGPLALVMNYAQLAARTDINREALTKYTGLIIEYSQRLNRLVEDLQTATRLSTGHFDLRREPYDLATEIRQAVEQFRTTVPNRRFSVVDEPGVGLVVMDRDRVLQAVRNLLDNAVKYSVEGGAIEVRVWEEGVNACVSVRDEGAGIADGDIERILRPFERGPGSTEVPGSGLGLYITRGIVQAHGGELRINNGTGPERARGAVFMLVLPRATAGTNGG